MILIFIVNKWPYVNSHTIAYLSRIRGRQVYVITLRCNLCDDIHPTPSSPTLSISLRFLLRILFLSKARHACGLSDLEISDITLGSSSICDKFPRPSHRLLLLKVNHQRSVIFSRSAAMSGSLCLYKLKWWAIVPPSIKGDGHNPNKRLLNRNCAILGLSQSGLSNQRKRNVFRSSSFMLIIRKAFSISTVSPTG